MRTWLLINQRCAEFKELILHLQAKFADLPPAQGPLSQQLKEALLDATDNELTIPSYTVPTAEAAKLSARIAQLA